MPLTVILLHFIVLKTLGEVMNFTKICISFLATSIFYFILSSQTFAMMREDDDSLTNQKSVIMQYVHEKLKHSDFPINTAQSRIFNSRSAPCYTASSGLSFCPPDRAIKVAVRLPFDLDEKCGMWQIAYHGTSCDAAFSIAKNGFDTNQSRQGKAYGPGVYVTPSWNMATQWTCDDAITSTGHVFGTVLQCRVRPGSFKAYPLTWENPPVTVEVDSNVCELVVQNPRNVVVYGILFKLNPHTTQ